MCSYAEQYCRPNSRWTLECQASGEAGVKDMENSKIGMDLQGTWMNDSVMLDIWSAPGLWSRVEVALKGRDMPDRRLAS